MISDQVPRFGYPSMSRHQTSCWTIWWKLWVCYCKPGVETWTTAQFVIPRCSMVLDYFLFTFAQKKILVQFCRQLHEQQNCASGRLWTALRGRGASQRGSSHGIPWLSQVQKEMEPPRGCRPGMMDLDGSWSMPGRTIVTIVTIV